MPSEPPKETHQAGFARRFAVLLRSDKGSYGRQVIRVRGVAETQCQADQNDEPQSRRSVQVTFEPTIYCRHGLAPLPFLSQRVVVSQIKAC